jgi:hypothetical protein
MKAIPTLLIFAAALLAADPKPKELTLQQKLDLAQARLQLAKTEAEVQAQITPLRDRLVSANTTFSSIRSHLLSLIGAPTDGSCDFDPAGAIVCRKPEPPKVDPPKADTPKPDQKK